MGGLTSQAGAALVALAERAGRAILDHYEAGPGRVAAKEDGSPVTAADAAAEAVILDGLDRHFPGEPVVAEERFTGDPVWFGDSPAFWLVDPLDGTREYIARNGEFTVNIARIEAGRPCFGVVHAPALGLTWWTDPLSGAALMHAPGGPTRTIVARTPGEGPLIVTASRSHGSAAQLDALLARLGPVERRRVGSSLKFCRLAEGTVDLYPRFGPTMEWDTAAGDAVLRAAGGVIIDAVTGEPLAYGKPGHLNGAFIAFGKWPEGERQKVLAAKAEG